MKMQNTKMSARSSNSRKAPAASKTSAVDRKIVRKAKAKNYSFAKPAIVPPAEYRSEIAGMEDSKTKAGEDAIDVLYDLVDDAGKKYHVRMRYPLDGYYYEELCEALLDAGLTEDSKLSDAVGLEEQVVLDYENGERIGSFVSRSPVSRKASTGQSNRSAIAEEEETEAFDEEDLLEEDDEFADLDFSEDDD